jgi:hypothetical protein
VKAVLLSLLLFCAAGCAGPILLPLNRAALRASRPGAILASRPPVPTFRTSEPALAMVLFGVVGLVISEVASEAETKNVRSRGVNDPADAIASVLMRGLMMRFALQALEGKIQARAMSVEELSREYHNSDLVLDVRTTEWGMSPTSATQYAIFYEGSLRLIDTRRQTVLAEGSCKVRPDRQPDDPSYGALMWRDATILKEKLRNAIQHCIDDYRTRVLGLTTQETWGRE